MKNPYLFQYLATFTGLLGITTSGMNYAWPSPSLPKMMFNPDDRGHINSTQGSWLVIITLIGGIFGCILATFFVDRIGRRICILLSAIPFFIPWIAIAYANTLSLMLIARFAAGIADGIVFAVVPLYVAEISNPKIRGMLGSCISASWILGMLLINLIGLNMSLNATALIASTFPLLLLVTFYWMPESPYFLLMKGDVDGARRSLQIFNRTTDVETELYRLKTAIKIQSEKRTHFWDLALNPNYRPGFYIIVLLRTVQQLSGVAAITFYTKTIFLEAGDFISSDLATILYVVLQLAMAILCSAIVDRLGRRPLLIFSIIGSGVALCIEGTYFYLRNRTDLDLSEFTFVPIVALLAFDIIFNVGMQPIPLLMVSELFPTDIKAVASAFCEIYFCLVAAGVSKFFQLMNDYFGISVPFFFFAACCFLSIVFLVAFVPETKGRTLEEIQETMAEKSHHHPHHYTKK